jgi:catechol 2,3-dioxygenase-like lactoylglutathione lyase family enzyme
MAGKSIRTPVTNKSQLLSRRRLLQSLPLLPLVPSALAQGAQTVAVRKIHCFDIRVSDVARSVRFYQDIFGAPVQARQGDTVCLRVGDGPRFFSISPLASGQEPGFSHIGLSVADFNLERVRNQLASHGIRPGSAPGANESGLDIASRSWVVNRSGTQELYFADEEGLVYLLTSESYCGGGGVLGDQCQAIEAAPGPGLFELLDYSHFTNFVGGRDRANNFYTTAFGKTYQAYQGPTSPVIGVGDGIQFLMYTGGNSAEPPTEAAVIHHTCFTMNNFNVDRILAQLTDYGLSAREDQSDNSPLQHWVSMRMPNRGGAEGGTPEVYFSDPDGIRIQLQDPGYCGGTGYLGDSCPSLV